MAQNKKIKVLGCISTSENYVDFGGARLRNIVKPILPTDITTKLYVDMSLKRNTEYNIDVLPVKKVYGNNAKPNVIPEDIKNSDNFNGTDGFYYLNNSNDSINWNIPLINVLKVSDIKKILFNLTLFSNTSIPFINICANGNNAVYRVETDSTNLELFVEYQFTIILDPTLTQPQSVPFISRLMILSDPYNYNIGKIEIMNTCDNNLDPNDNIDSITIETHDLACDNEVEFVVDKIKIVTDNGIFSYNFSSFLPEIDELKKKVDEIYDYLFDISDNIVH